ncbi:MAG TPA: hypothetical protein ENJ09_14370 [Planctomycetes bacterium]|nr:hypothetical protein [Planctomycetota bacterium]
MQRKILGAVVGAIGLAMVALFLLSRERRVQDMASVPAAQSQGEAVPGAGVQGVGEPGAASPLAKTGASSSGARVAQTGPVVFGRVQEASGKGIADAHVRLLALTTRDQEWEPAWRLGEWGRLDMPSAEARTGGQGDFHFDSWIGEGEGGPFVLVAEAPGYTANVVAGTCPVAAGEPIVIELAPSPPVEVQVVDASGAPVAGARVLQFGTAGSGGRWRGAEQDLFALARYASATVTADEAGVARFSPLAGEQVIVAEFEEARSLPWMGHPAGRITLRLLPGFELSGAITLPDWSALNYEGERRLRVTLDEGGLERNLVVLRRVEAGEYGPLVLPAVEGATYRVHLEGSPIIPVRERFRCPGPDAHVRVDLEAELGRNVWVAAYDVDDSHPLTESEATLRWEKDGKRNHVTRRSQPDGFINLWSIPDVPFSVVASAPGYVTEEFPQQSFPEQDGYVAVFLSKAGRIHGTCLRAGEPVSDFTVLAASAGGRMWSKKQFVGRADGSFEFDDVPLGTVRLSAFAADTPPSDTVAVEVQPGEGAEIQLELTPGWPRPGVVVDADSGEPVAGATLLRRISRSGNVTATWGEPIVSDASGEFTLPLLGKGSNTIEVLAPGYAKFVAYVDGGPDQVDTPLRIEIQRPVPLVVQLTGLAPGSYGGFTASSQDTTDPLPLRPFSPDGRVEYEAARPGTHSIRIDGRDALGVGVVWDVEVVLFPRSNRVVEVPVAGANRLEVEVPQDLLEQYDGSLWSWSRYPLASGTNVDLYLKVLADGVAQTDSVPASRIWTALQNPAGGILDARSATAEDGVLHVRFEDSKKVLQLYVVDPDGHPIPGVFVLAFASREGGRGAEGTTDQEGRVALRGLPDGKVALALTSKTLGLLSDVTVDGSKSEATVVFQADRKLQLQFVHEGRPVPGVQVDLMVAGRPFGWVTRDSDNDGRVSWSHIDAAQQAFRATHAGYWTEQLTVSTSETEDHWHTIPLRRLGTLTVRLLTADGAPAPGLPLSLVDRATGEDVWSWVDQKRVRASARGTDEQGRLTWHDLPDGPYTLSLPDGTNLGDLTVHGGVEQTVDFRLAP